MQGSHFQAHRPSHAHFYPLSWLTVAVMLVFTLWSGIDYLKGGWKYIASNK